MKKTLKGYSLIELLIVITIFAILCGLGIPAYRSLNHSIKADLEMIRLYRAIQFARHEAIKFNSVVTVCGTNNFVTCSRNWSKGYIVFVDSRQDGVIDSEDYVTKIFKFKVRHVWIQWRSFQNKSYLQMTPYGFTNNQNGTFLLCSTIGDRSTTRSIVINRAGRMRFSNDVSCR